MWGGIRRGWRPGSHCSLSQREKGGRGGARPGHRRLRRTKHVCRGWAAATDRREGKTNGETVGRPAFVIAQSRPSTRQSEKVRRACCRARAASSDESCRGWPPRLDCCRSSGSRPNARKPGEQRQGARPVSHHLARAISTRQKWAGQTDSKIRTIQEQYRDKTGTIQLTGNTQSEKQLKADGSGSHVQQWRPQPGTLQRTAGTPAYEGNPISWGMRVSCLVSQEAADHTGRVGPGASPTPRKLTTSTLPQGLVNVEGVGPIFCVLANRGCGGVHQEGGRGRGLKFQGTPGRPCKEQGGRRTAHREGPVTKDRSGAQDEQHGGIWVIRRWVGETWGGSPR